MRGPLDARSVLTEKAELTGMFSDDGRRLPELLELPLRDLSLPLLLPTDSTSLGSTA